MNLYRGVFMDREGRRWIVHRFAPTQPEAEAQVRDHTDYFELESCEHVDHTTGKTIK